ncbi:MULTISPECIES: alpha/beta hydrolase [unclassified Novosphingobium]|uniref:alpha/beta hydrolase n=1 Tax=unclassified Novosphingobium TaxID=2644732 RepID=UPI00146DCF19|nr:MULTISPECIES: alpha/beta hydrolase [unclassified Novosphingobium]NMN05436.1 acetyl esterase/lipase [Novosphingobium sp. SG919]NMN87731.1 acetyl esterase/lipase [Novosphingobium sp. SG916]
MIDRRKFLCHGAASVGAGLGVALAGPAAWAADPLAGVDPALRAGADIVLKMGAQLSPLTAARLPILRQGSATMAAPLRPDVPVEERKVPVGAGIPDVTVFVINAGARPGGAPRPAILHTHGGGFVAGAARAERGYLQDFARTLDCVIVTVEYTLAPEARFARSTAETYAALRWLHAQAETLGVDRRRLAVMGESAGGGHAALLAIIARDHGEVPLVLQVLTYPMLDDRTGSTVTPPPGVGKLGWDAQANRFGWASFLGVTPGSRAVPAAGVPARLADPRGLAPAFVAVGGIDLFVDEDITYARRLTDAGVPTELLVIPGAYHGFDRVVPDAGPSRRLIQARFDALRRAFA